MNSPGVSDADQCWRLKARASERVVVSASLRERPEKGGLNDEVPTFFFPAQTFATNSVELESKGNVPCHFSSAFLQCNRTINTDLCSNHVLIFLEYNSI